MHSILASHTTSSLDSCCASLCSYRRAVLVSCNTSQMPLKHNVHTLHHQIAPWTSLAILRSQEKRAHLLKSSKSASRRCRTAVCRGLQADKILCCRCRVCRLWHVRTGSDVSALVSKHAGACRTGGSALTKNRLMRWLHITKRVSMAPRQGIALERDLLQPWKPHVLLAACHKHRPDCSAGSAAMYDHTCSMRGRLTVAILGTVLWPPPLVVVGLSPLMDHVSGNGICKWPLSLRWHGLLEVWASHGSSGIHHPSSESLEDLWLQLGVMRSLHFTQNT